MPTVGALAAQLTRSQKIRLLRIAREAIFQYINRGKVPTIEEEDPRLLEEQGVFVSLHIGDRLRGCIGNFVGEGPLFKTVVDISVGAAAHDPRFAPMRMDEVPRTEIELSILGPLQLVGAEEVVVGDHGLLITVGRNRGTLLPQVATQYDWSREEFLSQTCQKAGLDRDAWRSSDARIEVFTAEVFAESDMRPVR